MSQLDYKTEHCKNCGHPQHCEGPLWKENKCYQDGAYNEYKACDRCRCSKCAPDQKTDIPSSMLNGL
jgi:hypothetical protein